MAHSLALSDSPIISVIIIINVLDRVTHALITYGAIHKSHNLFTIVQGQGVLALKSVAVFCKNIEHCHYCPCPFACPSSVCCKSQLFSHLF